MITGHTKGHLIYYKNGWRYKKSKKLVKEDDILKCPRCSQKSKNNEPDPCTGFISGAKSVCCGHGIEKPYKILEN